MAKRFARNSRTRAGSVSKERLTTRNPLSFQASCHRVMRGRAATQGGHQVAQKSSSTTEPRRPSSLTTVRSSSISVTTKLGSSRGAESGRDWAERGMALAIVSRIAKTE